MDDTEDRLIHASFPLQVSCLLLTDPNTLAVFITEAYPFR